MTCPDSGRLTDSTLITRGRDLLALDLDGEIVLMSIERGNYYGLVRTARRIWELLESPRSFADLCRCLVSEYAAPTDVIESDVRRFVLAMRDETIVDLS